jgi:ABC-type Mn2+/Zn2+ transport system permease subunit
METIDFLGILIVGSALSLAIQYIKNKYGTESDTTKALTVLLSVALGAAYWFLSQTGIWTAILGVLGTASTFYAFFLKKS